jgi:NAD-dependent dihydropyrimidine dehydrogenase PreA subunit
MAEQLHVVNLETCTGDGICAEICPEDILEMVDEKAATVENRAGACILCGQCIAVCPTESLAMPKLRDGIPKDNKVCTSLVLGYPKYKYRRSIRRDLGGVRYH